MSFNFTAGRFKAWASDGTQLAGGRLYTFSSGTTTFKAAYTDSTLGTPCTYVNDGSGGLYIALDARGETQLWLGSGAYTFKLTDSSGLTVWTVDSVQDQEDEVNQSLSATSGAGLIGFDATQSYASGTFGRALQNATISVTHRPWSAAGDGATNDAAAIQSAINYLSSIGGGTLYFPPGSYLVGANVLLKSNVRLIGAGISSVLLLSGNNRQCLYSNSVSDLEISHLCFNGQKPSVGYETANNYDFGIRLGESASGQNVKRVNIHHCTFKDIGLDGIYVDNCQDVTIDDSNNFINCRRWGVVVEDGSYGSTRVSVGGTFDCTNGTGPSGKEYPLGAIDAEPFDPAAGGITYLSYGRIISNKGKVQMSTYAKPVSKSSVREVTVQDADFSLDNLDYVKATDILVAGTNGYLKIDIAADGIITTVRELDVTFETGRTPVRLSNGRANLLPIDFADERSFNQASSISGAGSSTGYVSRVVDGNAYQVRNLSAGPGSSVYTLRHALQATVTSGDQVFMYFEIERTDGNSATGNFFTVSLDSGSLLSRTILPLNGTSQYMIAFKAGATVANPVLSFGISGTPGVAVSLLVTKCFVLVNPTSITPATLKATPASFQSTYTGTATGFAVNPSGSIQYVRDGNQVVLHIPSGVFTGTSNSTAFTITGAPSEIRPITSKRGFGRFIDNSVSLTTPGVIDIGTDGTLSMSKDCAGGVFVNSGTKAISASTVTYSLD